MKSRLAYILYPLIFLFLIVGYFHPITALGQDLGRHLLTGKIIVNTFSVPQTNLFSYTFPEYSFINHHWLFEVIAYLLHSVTGYPGLFVFSIMVITAAFGLIFFKARRDSSPLVLAFLSLIYLRILFERTDLRPELLSFLFMAAITAILFSYKERFTKLIYLIIPIQLLWTNTHIYFPIGMVLLTLFSIDMVVTKRKDLLSRYPLTLFFVTAISGLTLLINPNGIEGALYPLRVFDNYGYTIEENQTPFFLQSLGFPKPAFLYLQIAIATLFLSLLLTFKKSRLVDWLLAIVFTIIALSAVRNFPLFVFATFIPCVRSLSILANAMTRSLSPQRRHVASIILTGGFFLLLIWQIQHVVSYKSFGYGITDPAQKALDFYKENNLKGPIFNNFDIGSYIEYRLYPQERVFIDGRPEAYPASFLQDTYIKMQEDKKIFTEVSNKYNFNTIIFSHTDQTPWAEAFLKDITHDPLWTPIYLDPQMIILVKNSETNKSLISKYGLPIEKLPLQSNNPSLRELFSSARFYSVIGDLPRYEQTLHNVLSHDPQNCVALMNLLTLYQHQNNPASVGILSRYQASCQ